MAQGLSTPDPSLSPTHLSIRRGRATTTHYTHHQVSLMVSCNTTLVPSLWLCIGPACEAGLSVGMRRERVPPQRIKIKIKKTWVWHACLCGLVDKSWYAPDWLTAAGHGSTPGWDC